MSRAEWAPVKLTGLCCVDMVECCYICNGAA